MEQQMCPTMLFQIAVRSPTTMGKGIFPQHPSSLCDTGKSTLWFMVSLASSSGSHGLLGDLLWVFPILSPCTYSSEVDILC